MIKRPDDLSEVILITHQGCMDGCGSAILFMRAGGQRENVRWCAAGMVERMIKNERLLESDKFIIFADVGLTKGSASKYADELEKRGNCVLIDHHATSEWLSSREWCDIRMEGCGTELLRQYLGLEDDSSKALARLIDDHDRWLRKDTMSEQLATFVTFVGHDEFISRFLSRDINNGVFTLLEEEMLAIMIRRRDEMIADAIKKVVVREIDLDGETLKVGYITSQEQNTSLMLNRLLEQRHDIDVAAQINLHKRTVSLRSINGYDTTKLAQKFGGGGHKAASGHRMSDSIVNELIERIHS